MSRDMRRHVTCHAGPAAAPEPTTLPLPPTIRRPPSALAADNRCSLAAGGCDPLDAEATRGVPAAGAIRQNSDLELLS